MYYSSVSPNKVLAGDDRGVLCSEIRRVVEALSYEPLTSSPACGGRTQRYILSHYFSLVTLPILLA